MKTRIALALAASALLGARMLPAYAQREDFHVVVNAVRENAISAGMTQGEVLAALGPPAMRAAYGPDRGPSWAYPIDGVIPGTRAFYVNFGPDRRVVSAQEYSSPAGG
jgi:hypothetical protein